MRFAQYLILLVILTCGQFASAEQIRIKFSHAAQPQSPQGKATEYFKRLVEQRSNNRVQVEINPASEISEGQNTLVALRENQVQLAAPNLSGLFRVDPQLQLLNLPFLFTDAEHLKRVIDSEVGQKLLRSASRDGLKALAFWDNGFKHLSTNRPVTKPTDLQGLRLRLSGGKAHRQEFAKAGVSIQASTDEPIYEALASGKIDGQESRLAEIAHNGLDQVQSDLTLTAHASDIVLILTNQAFWNQIPDDLRVIIRGAINDSADYNREMVAERNSRALKELEHRGKIKIHFLSQADKEIWREKFISLGSDLQGIDSEMVLKARKERLK